MAIKLYNPRTKAFANFTAPDSGDLPLSDLLQLNILIELRLLAEFMAADSADTPDDLRTDIVSNL